MKTGVKRPFQIGDRAVFPCDGVIPDYHGTITRFYKKGDPLKEEALLAIDGKGVQCFFTHRLKYESGNGYTQYCLAVLRPGDIIDDADMERVRSACAELLSPDDAGQDGDLIYVWFDDVKEAVKRIGDLGLIAEDGE